MKIITSSVGALASHRKPLISTACAMALLAMAPVAQAVVMFGTLANFDVVNDTGQDAYGFEIELVGVSGAGYTFSANRYGSPQTIPYTSGVYVRWGASWDFGLQQWVQSNATIPQLVGAGPATVAYTQAQVVATAGHQCVYWLANYATSGCDHFGVSLPYYSPQPTQVVYRWLWANPDPLHAGEFVYAGTNFAPPSPTAAAPVPPPPPYSPPVVIPQPVFNVDPAQPDVVVAQIQAPKPERPDLQFGEARWVKVFKTELPREVGLDELQGDNAAVPKDPAQVETQWKLLQHNPHNPDSGGSVLKSQSRLNSGSRSVVRRYEFYKFTGSYDPIDHGAICADGLCNTPSDGELGDYVGAQMAAANVGNPQVKVTKAGNGSVSGGLQGVNKTPLSCGNNCSVSFNLNDVVVLTANPASGAVFAGWGGSCSGAQPTCTLTVTDEMAVTANFSALYTLSVGRSGAGAVAATPAGNDKTLDCGKTCSAKFAQGTVVTLTATPTAGHKFLNWSGSGAGACNLSAVPTCNVAIAKDTSIQANFQ